MKSLTTNLLNTLGLSKLILILLLTPIDTMARDKFTAKAPISKHCLQLGRQYRHAVKTNNPIRHLLAEKLWKECGV
jgi:hypothetical protein